MRHDVIMPTLDSASRIGEKRFRQVLRAIYSHIPVNRLLVIDDGSSDQTVDILKQFDAVIIRGMGSLGKARELGIKHAETEWFYFVDDDNLVTPDFHEKMWRYSDEKTGMVFARAIVPYDNYIVRHERVIGRLRHSIGAPDAMEGRGYTGATLTNKKAMEGIKIPAVGRQEDYYIKKYCQQRKWKVKYASSVIVWHFHRSLPTFQINYQEGYGMAVVEAISRERMLTSWLLTYPKCLFTFPYVRKSRLLGELPKMYYMKYKGYVDGKRTCSSRAEI